MALEQGREVYALPGRVSDSLSDGCNRLIRQGAGAATCPEDILEFFFGTGDREHSDADRNRQGREQITGQKTNVQTSSAYGNHACETGENGVSAGRAGEKCNPAGGTEEVDNPAERSNENSFPEENIFHEEDIFHEENSIHEENREERRLPEECTGEDDISAEKLSLEQGILGILSDENETHIERLFEQIRHYEEQGLLSADDYSLSDVITCLIRMKIDGRVEESSAGYYKRGRR